MAIARPANPAVAAARVVAPAAPARAADEKWDMLLVCIAGYFLASVGRVHELFPVLQILRPAVVGGLLAIGLSLGGPTGYAINPARDLAPRLAHALLPIPGQRDSDWRYAWVPILGPLAGAVLAAIAVKTLNMT